MEDSTHCTLRPLPDGAVREVRKFERSEELARLELALDTPALRPSTLVEIVTPEAIFLGEILANEASPGAHILTVELNHALDRSQLAAIHQEWR